MALVLERDVPGTKQYKNAHKKKYLLIRYNNINGEHEYCGHAVLVVHPRKKNENAVHEYFQDFWGRNCNGKYNIDKRETIKYSYYMYFSGEVAVNDIRWEEITERQYNVLKDVHLA